MDLDQKHQTGYCSRGRDDCCLQANARFENGAGQNASCRFALEILHHPKPSKRDHNSARMHRVLHKFVSTSNLGEWDSLADRKSRQPASSAAFRSRVAAVLLRLENRCCGDLTNRELAVLGAVVSSLTARSRDGSGVPSLARIRDQGPCGESPTTRGEDWTDDSGNANKVHSDRWMTPNRLRSGGRHGRVPAA